MSIRLLVAVVYFLILYLIAVASSWNCKWGENEFHFLGISDTQWKALFLLWLPVIVALVKQGE